MLSILQEGIREPFGEKCTVFHRYSCPRPPPLPFFVSNRTPCYYIAKWITTEDKYPAMISAAQTVLPAGSELLY